MDVDPQLQETDSNSIITTNPNTKTTMVKPTSSSSSSTASSPFASSPTTNVSRYENQKRRDWNTFGQYLRERRQPVPLFRCSGIHVIEFLKYLDLFGKTKVHTQTCQFFGQSNSPAPCSCPLQQAWGSLDALVGRLRAAYEDYGGNPERNPFGARAVGLYLRQVKDSQAKARGMSFEKKRKRPPVPPLPPSQTPPPPPVADQKSEVGTSSTPPPPVADQISEVRTSSKPLLPPISDHNSEVGTSSTSPVPPQLPPSQIPSTPPPPRIEDQNSEIGASSTPLLPPIADQNYEVETSSTSPMPPPSQTPSTPPPLPVADLISEVGTSSTPPVLPPPVADQNSEGGTSSKPPLPPITDQNSLVGGLS